MSKCGLLHMNPASFFGFNHSCTQEQISDPPSGQNSSSSLWLGLTGWDLVNKLHSIGLDDPGELARLLEEEDPFKVAV